MTVTHVQRPPHDSAAPKLWGYAVGLETVEQILSGAEKVRDAGYKKWDAHTPFPVHGLNDAMGLRLSHLPWVTLICGVTGATTALLMQWFTNAFDYPILVAGKPLFSVPANIPVTFELTILFAAIGTFLGMLISNGLPQLYHPLFRNVEFRRATADRFFIVIEATDPLFDPQRTRDLLASLGGPVETIED
jgi:hypothetical protein